MIFFIYPDPKQLTRGPLFSTQLGKLPPAIQVATAFPGVWRPKSNPDIYFCDSCC